MQEGSDYLNYLQEFATSETPENAPIVDVLVSIVMMIVLKDSEKLIN